MFAFFPLILGIYVTFRLVKPLNVRTRTKVILTGIVFLIASYYVLNRFIFGGLSTPEQPPIYIIIGGFLFVSLFLLALFLLILDVILLFDWFAYLCKLKKTQIKRHRFLLPVLVILSCCLSAVGVYEALKTPTIKEVNIELKQLPPSLNGLTIIQISDLHASPLFNQQWMNQVVDRINNQKPDLILITGDFLDGTPEKRLSDIMPLTRLKSRIGVYGVVGNHEYYSNYLRWTKTFQAIDLKLLLNEHVILKHNNMAFKLVGVTDPVAQQFHLPRPDIKKALGNTKQSVFTILMAHQPKLANEYKNYPIDLQLSGHTHGGLILGFHYIVAVFNQDFVSGLYNLGTLKLYVHSGTGLWNGFPVRLGVPSEITKITLLNQSSLLKKTH